MGTYIRKYIGFTFKYVYLLLKQYAEEFPTHGAQYAEPNLRQKRDISQTTYTGRTWCVTVPHDFIIVRRAAYNSKKNIITKTSRPLMHLIHVNESFNNMGITKDIVENYEIYSGNFDSAIVFGKYHPSASLSAYGDTYKLLIIQSSLRLVKIVTNLLNAGMEVH